MNYLYWFEVLDVFPTPNIFNWTEWLCPSPCANQALTCRDMTFQQHLCHVSPCLLCSWLMMNYRGLHLFLWFLRFSIICEAIPYDSTRRREIWTKFKTLGTFFVKRIWSKHGTGLDQRWGRLPPSSTLGSQPFEWVLTEPCSRSKRAIHEFTSWSIIWSI